MLMLISTLAATALGAASADTGAAQARDTAVFAGGCFWGVEAVFEHVNGVVGVVSGYSGGSVASPSYEQVSGGRTGHAESVRVVYDPARVSYAQLLEVFFRVAHDPTQLNRQGPDVGTQYRSAIYVRGAAQEAAARDYVRRLAAARVYDRPIVTEISRLSVFHEAEAYHQDFLARHPTHPYIVFHDMPKLRDLRRRYPTLYRG